MNVRKRFACHACRFLHEVFCKNSVRRFNFLFLETSPFLRFYVTFIYYWFSLSSFTCFGTRLFHRFVLFPKIVISNTYPFSELQLTNEYSLKTTHNGYYTNYLVITVMHVVSTKVDRILVRTGLILNDFSISSLVL